MQLLFLQYYTKFGIRRLTQMQNPVGYDLTGLPKSSVLHYTQVTEGEIMDLNCGLFKDYGNKIQVDYVEELIDPIGNPRRVPKPLLSIVKKFHMDNKQFVYRRDAITAISDPSMLVVLNYSLLDQFYRYPTTPLSRYNRWRDYTTTVLTTLNKACKDSAKYHFLEIDTPELVPSLQMLRNFSGKEIAPATLKIFPTEQSWWMLEFWKFLDPDTRSSSILSLIEPANYPKVVLLFKTAQNLQVPMCLAYLNSWIKGQENQTEFSAVQSLRFDIIQKLFLLFCMNLKKKTESEEELPVDPAEPDMRVDPNSNEEDNLSHDEEPETHEDADETGEVENELPISMANKNKKDDSNKIKTLSEIENSGLDGVGFGDFKSQLDNLDEDLKALDLVNKKRLEDSGLKIDGTEIEQDLQESQVDNVTEQELEDQVYKDPGVYDTLAREIEHAAEVGMISVSDMRKLHKLVQAQPQSKDPYGSNKTLEQASAIKPEDLEITPEAKAMVVSPVVLDPSMKESALISYNRDYIKHNLRKDVLNAVVGVQKSGVIVRKHTVEENHSALGSFEIHTVELKPIAGNPSTIRMKLPIVDEEGCFTANNVKFQMRAQRVD